MQYDPNGKIIEAEDDFFWDPEMDDRPKEEIVDDLIDDPTIWFKNKKANLQCLHCNETSLSVSASPVNCSCGRQKIYISKAMRGAAEALHNAGFVLRGANDMMITDDFSNDVLCLVFVDFDDIYDEGCFFREEWSLRWRWKSKYLTDSAGRRFTRVYARAIALNSIIHDKSEDEINRLAEELEEWSNKFKDSGAITVMTYLGIKGNFWKNTNNEIIGNQPQINHD